MITMEDRIKKIQEKLRGKNIDAFLVSTASNIFYLTGLKGILDEREFLLIVLKDGFELIVPEMYGKEAKGRSPSLVMAKERGGLFAAAIDGFRNYQNIGFEREDLKYGEYLALFNNLKGKNIVPVSKFIEDSRKIKSEEEINLIKKAVEIGDKTFDTILKIIKPGLSEKYIQRKIIEIMEDFGTEGSAFPPIVASGSDSAEPHHHASNKKIEEGEILLLDIGARYKGYCSDLSRTLFIGKAGPRLKKIYELVLETQLAAMKKCKPGYPIKNLYNDAVFNFAKQGEEKRFIHSLGHGLGIETHEPPNVGPAAEGVFEKGMVITIEPGLYYDNFGGVRIEDLCLIGEKCEVLSKAPKKLIEIRR